MAFQVVEDPADGARRVSELVESTGGRVEERTERAAVTFLGVALPWLVTAALVAAGVVLLARRRRPTPPAPTPPKA